MAGNAVYSGLWDGTTDVNGAAGGHAFQSGRNPLDKKMARVLKRRGMRELQAIVDSITTSNTVGSNVTYPRVKGDEAALNLGSVVVNGGAVAIETVTQRSSGSVTAAEVTRVDEIAQHDVQPTYPTDAGGNGGGGKGVDTAPGLG